MSSSQNTNNTRNKVSLLKWLPWVLLLLVLVAFIWLFTSMKSSSEATWEPPRTPPAEQQASEP
ncbi:MAG: serine protease, partial [Psychrobacter sp.]